MSRRTSHRPSAPSPRAAAALGLALVLSLVAGGCGGVDDEQQAIEQAAMELNALGIAGSTPLPTTRRGATFDEIIKTLQPITGDGDPGEKAAAGLLLAKAHAGKGELASERAAKAEAQALYQMEVLRAAVDLYVSQNSVAAALASYDPSQEIAALDAQIAERRRELDAARAEREAQVARIAELQSRADAARARAEQERGREVQVRAGLTGSNEQLRDSIVAQAHEVRRAADGHDREAAGFAAEVAKEQPEAEAMQRQIDRLTRQIELLDAAKRAVGVRAEGRRRNADAARQEAQNAAATVDRLLNGEGEAKGLTAMRAETDEPTEESVRAYTAAVSAAKAAGGAGGQQGKSAAAIAAGSYQQALGDVYAGRARGLQSYAVALEMLAAVQPPLPGDHAAMAKAAATAADEARAQAEEAYGNALSSFESAGGARERLERVSAALRTLSGQGAADPETDEVAEPAADADAPMEDAPGEEPPADEVPAEDAPPEDAPGDVPPAEPTDPDAPPPPGGG